MSGRLVGVKEVEHLLVQTVFNVCSSTARIILVFAMQVLC
jgi:TRAP-type C4-dicarboxylate transport system permease small subunit